MTEENVKNMETNLVESVSSEPVSVSKPAEATVSEKDDSLPAKSSESDFKNVVKETMSTVNAEKKFVGP